MKKQSQPVRPVRPLNSGFAKRRALLLGGISLPATTLLSVLGGCGGGGDGVAPVANSATGVSGAATVVGPVVPLPPYTPATAPVPPTPSNPVTPELSAPVTHVPDVPSAPTSKAPVVMNVAVYNAEFDSFHQDLPRRQVAANTPGAVSIPDPSDKSKTLYLEDIHTYLQHTLDSKFALVNRAMLTAFAAHRPSEFDVSFFTIPEFFWNAPWAEFVNTDEIAAAADFCLTAVTEKARKLIARFPACRYGNIVLLPGTIAVLKPSSASNSSGKAVDVYSAYNRLVCTHNLPLDEPHHPRPAYMIWPKRVVSGIDFIGKGGCRDGVPLAPNPVNPVLTDETLTCMLGKDGDLKVNIEFVSSDLAQSFDIFGQLLTSSFKNDIVRGLPFGIDICLDYLAASVQNDRYRMAELDDRRFKLDFVLSAGMFLDTRKYSAAPLVQYAIHNDGIPGTNENRWNEPGKSIDVRGTLYSDIWKLQYDSAAKKVHGDLVAPLDSTSWYDTDKGVILVSADDAFKVPAEVDMKDIPAITDKLNSMKVRIWKLPVDVTDTGVYPGDIAALVPARCAS
jgi:hypothetical protein